MRLRLQPQSSQKIVSNHTQSCCYLLVGLLPIALDRHLLEKDCWQRTQSTDHAPLHDGDANTLYKLICMH